jgi:hypothetical protein
MKGQAGVDKIARQLLELGAGAQEILTEGLMPGTEG